MLLEGMDLHRDFGIVRVPKVDQSTAVTSFCEFLRSQMSLEAASTVGMNPD
ncbi:hypothetical protein D3C81_2201140 [compost metagenome]